MNLKSLFTPTPARVMVDHLNNGWSPTSWRARTFLFRTGQFRLAVAGVAGFLLCAWILTNAFPLVLMSKEPNLYSRLIPASMLLALNILFTVYSAIGAFSFLRILVAAHGPAHWTRPLQGNPAQCKELVDLAKELGAEGVAAMNRPLYLADLVMAKQLVEQREDEKTQAALAEGKLAYAQKAASYCTEAHSLVKTEAS